MSTQIQLKRDTAADWTSNNPTLAAGEVGYETDTGAFKIGDGSTAWTSLDYTSGKPVAWTPTFTNWTQGNGTVDAAEATRFGKFLYCTIKITFGTTSSVDGSGVMATLPSNFATGGFFYGGVQIIDTGTARYLGTPVTNSTDKVDFRVMNTSGTYLVLTSLNVTVPHTWATTDTLECWLVYEEE